MSASFRYHPDAWADAQEAVDFYATADPRLGREFYATLERVIARAVESPLLGQPTRSGCRKRVFPRFPYSLIYFCLDEGIEIYAVAHHRRRPDFWLHRVDQR